MHYGEYLVQHKVLSAHQVLKGLAEQRNRRLYIPLLLVEIGALEDFRALRICAVAEEKFEEFLEVLVDEGFIDPDQCQQIRVAWMKSAPPLGQILVELGSMDAETLAITLAEFEEERASQQIDSVPAG